jgi:hypothetical protein
MPKPKSTSSCANPLCSHSLKKSCPKEKKTLIKFNTDHYEEPDGGELKLSNIIYPNDKVMCFGAINFIRISTISLLSLKCYAIKFDHNSPIPTEVIHFIISKFISFPHACRRIECFDLLENIHSKNLPCLDIPLYIRDLGETHHCNYNHVDVVTGFDDFVCHKMGFNFYKCDGCGHYFCNEHKMVLGYDKIYYCLKCF